MDDVLVLISARYTTDYEGNQIPIPVRRTVFCKVGSVGRTEFYQAAQNGMHPDYIFTLSNYKDYENEKYAEYIDWHGIKHDLYITRAYRSPDGDSVELTAEERTGSETSGWDSDESESGEES